MTPIGLSVLCICGFLLALAASPGLARAEVATPTSSPLHVLLVRHGTAEQDALTPRGVAEAKAAGTALKKREIVAIVASPTRRTHETASIIAMELGLASVVTHDEAFMVRDGETVADATSRALAAARVLAERYAAKTVVVVTHFDVCAALLRLAAADPKAGPCPKHALEAPSITEITVSPDGRLNLPLPSS